MFDGGRLLPNPLRFVKMDVGCSGGTFSLAATELTAAVPSTVAGGVSGAGDGFFIALRLLALERCCPL
jgi:hypothetical protein